ncbi:MAG: lytic transglycosylase domain-containing protein [Saprospiraceae bacterium]
MRHKFIYLYALVVSFGIAWIMFFPGKKAGNSMSASLLNTYREGGGTRSFDLSKNFEFSGERFPTEIFDVRERLDRELMVNAYLQSTTVLNIKLAARYFPQIETILKEEGVPDDFKYLAVAESTLRNVSSNAGAKGIWQFMKPTAIQYGLEVSEEVDERYQLEKATHAACQLLKDNYKRFGSWILAAAAYNEGAPRLAREMAEQRGKNYFDLNLNDETSRYVFRIMAIKEIMQHPEEYDFFVENEHLYEKLKECNEIVVEDTVENWADFAQSYNLNYRIFKVYNPWLIGQGLSNKTKKRYLIKIPKNE